MGGSDLSSSIMRDVLSKQLEKFILEDENVIIMDADLASANGTTWLHEKYPSRIINVGISEANMTSMAGGMSAYGLNPFIITFTAFASRRICDQIAISCAYAKQNVKIIATDAGVTSQNNGGTHMSLEDIGIVRSIPEVIVFEAVDGIQLEKALPVIKDMKGVIYVRMVRKDSPDVFDEDYEFKMFEATVVSEGADITIVASGISVSEAVKAKKILNEKGINPEIIAVHTIKPIDSNTIINSAKKTKKVLCVENHNIHGGLYSSVAEVLSSNYPVMVKSLSIKDHFGEVGSTEFLMDKYKISSKYIVETVLEMLK